MGLFWLYLVMVKTHLYIYRNSKDAYNIGIDMDFPFRLIKGDILDLGSILTDKELSDLHKIEIDYLEGDMFIVKDTLIRRKDGHIYLEVDLRASND